MADVLAKRLLKLFPVLMSERHIAYQVAAMCRSEEEAIRALQTVGYPADIEMALLDEPA